MLLILTSVGVVFSAMLVGADSFSNSRVPQQEGGAPYLYVAIVCRS